GAIAATRLPAGETEQAAIVVPAGVSKIVLSLQPGVGQDADLFARLGREATEADYDCGSKRDSGQSEGCVLEVEAGDVVFYQITAQSSANFVFFSAAQEEKEKTNLELQHAESVVLAGGQLSSADYYFSAGDNKAVIASVVGHRGDVALLLGIDRMPSLDAYDCLADASADAIEICSLSDIENSTIFAKVISKGASSHNLSIAAAESIGQETFETPLVYQQNDNGVVAVEAESAARSSIEGAKWQPEAEVLASGGRSMQLIGAGFSSNIQDNPKLEMHFAGSSAGQANIWVRAAKADATTASFRALQFDQTQTDTLFYSVQGGEAKSVSTANLLSNWQWLLVDQMSVKTDETNTIELWGAEAGLKIDKIIVSAVGVAAPVGTGAGQSLVQGETGKGGTEQGEQPELPDGVVDPTDTDGDGLLDAWEMEHFGSLEYDAAADPDGDGQSNAQELAQQSDPVVAPPIISDLKSRPVVPGTVGGSLAVSASGAAVYTVPIELPPGVNGHAPSLALNYSSQAGVGPLGMGWTLSGLSSISRCGRSKVMNGEHHAVDYTQKDMLCLDGQQLLPTDNNYDDYWSEGKTYHPAMDPDTRVTVVVDQALGKTRSFTVSKADGMTHYYRHQQDRNLGVHRLGSSWQLSRSEDVSGNRIDYSYTSTVN
ncbi:MAG: SpvB/TcaC N-terminal domain-containing protein, partial [Granulosicoccaceae bacterium]